MMKVTVYSIGDVALGEHFIATIASPERHTILPLSAYVERMARKYDAPDAPTALEMAWEEFQNIDANRRVPDGGRSLMTGDLAKVDIEGQSSTWWICCTIGWGQTVEPALEVQNFGR